MTTFIVLFAGAALAFTVGFFVGVNNAKAAQAKIDAAKAAADAAKKIVKN